VRRDGRRDDGPDERYGGLTDVRSAQSTVRHPQYVSRTDTTPDGPDPDPNDVWAFTDPDARDEYTRQGRLKRLERDIHYEVMRGGPWQPEELEYKSEIRQLLREGAIADKGTYWFRSPHPTIYRAQREGVLSVAGRIYCFGVGDDLVFQCRMERDEAVDNPGAMLCGNWSDAMRDVRRRM